MHGEEPESLSENVAFLNVFKILNNEKVMPSLYSGVKGFLELYVLRFLFVVSSFLEFYVASFQWTSV